MCQRHCFFRVNANCFSPQERGRGSFSAAFYVQGANWDGGQGRCGDVLAGGRKRGWFHHLPSLWERCLGL